MLPTDPVVLARLGDTLYAQQKIHEALERYSAAITHILESRSPSQVDRRLLPMTAAPALNGAALCLLSKDASKERARHLLLAAL